MPTRAEELVMISKIKKSFQDQPYWKYYMNEGVRTSKMEHVKGLHKHRADKWTNYVRGVIFTTILTVPFILRYYSWGPYGVPAYHYPIRYEHHFFEGHNGPRKLRSTIAIFLVAYTGGKMYSLWRTSFRFPSDEDMEKATVQLPY